MFDARSLLELIMRGGQAQPAPQQAGGGLGDILGQLGKALGQPGAQQQGGQSGGGGLGDILGQLGKAMGQDGQPQARNVTPDQGRQAAPQGGSLEDILKNMLPGGSGPGSGGQAQQGGGGGGLMDILGQVLGQATQGAREGAGRIDDATGASGQLRDVLAKATGRNPDEIMAQLKDLIANNQTAAAAGAGGLGAVILGTRTGRSLAGKALKLGGLALIGGLAYKALQNYQQGRPLISGPTGAAPPEAPRGSGFESTAVTNDSAALYMRAMIAAAASDGRIDASEQQKLIGGVQQAGLGAQAQEFLTGELNNPATAEELARFVNSPAEAVQLYTAARVSIDLDTAEEHEFLVALQQALGIDDQLAAHIDAEARAAA